MGAVSTAPYSSVSISGYNSSPPSDDGAQTAANQVSWAKHTSKLSGPVKTLAESINAGLVTAFAKSVNTDADVRNQFSGSVAFDWATATLATDSIYPTYSAVMVGSESGATSDTLQYISATGVYAGCYLAVRQRNSTEEVVLVHATSTAATATNANLYLTGNANITLNDINRIVPFRYDSNVASGWVQEGSGNSGAVVTRAYGEYLLNTGATAVFVVNDVIPTATNGLEIISISIAAKSASNRMRVRSSAWGDPSNATFSGGIFADFPTSTATCINARASLIAGAGARELNMEVERSIGTSGTHTYSLRVGSTAGTLWLNGSTSTRYFGGIAKCTLIAEEIVP